MKPPPLLLGAALVFWGWQSDLLPAGGLLAVLVESARVIHRRWEFSDEDFAKVWTFCSLLFLGSAMYAFTANEGPSAFSGFLQEPTYSNQRQASGASARTAAAMFRWLPMIFFPFLAAQLYSTREAIPLATISLILRRRRQKAREKGESLPPDHYLHVGYPYFAATLLASAVHPGENNTFFWGLAVLLGWGLLAVRPRRFGLVVWAGTLIVAVTLGFYGQAGIGHLQSYFERLNPAWLQRFLQRNPDSSRSRTAIGRIGQLKLSGKIVIRVQPQEGGEPPNYLREASYRSYRSPMWSASGRREGFEGNVGEEYPNSRTWRLLEVRKTNNSVAQIACSLPGGIGLLPLPTGAWRLENLPAYVLQKNDLGAIRAEGPGLVMFDAFYGPGTSIDSDPTEEDRSNVPFEEREALDQIVTQLRLRDEPDARGVMRKLQQFFAENYSYSTWQDPPRFMGTNFTALGRFLHQTRRGHCEYFATATTLLLRRAYVPARYAVGYYVHERAGNKFVVRLRDAHAWCLVWDEKARHWVEFDTTPASWIEEEAKTQSSFQWLSDAWTRLTFEIAKFRWGQSRVRQYLLILIVPGLMVLAYQIFFRRRRLRGDHASEAATRAWPGLDSEFYALEAALAARGLPREPSESLSDWLERATQSADLADLRSPLNHLLRLHYRHRFDPLGLEVSDRTALREEARACLQSLAQREHVATSQRDR